MKRSSTALSSLNLKEKAVKNTSIERSVTRLEPITKQNRGSNRQHELVRIKSSNRLIFKCPSSTTLQSKTKYVQPHRRLVKHRGGTDQEISSNQELGKLFKRKRNFYAQSQKQLPHEQPRLPAPKNYQSVRQIKESKVQRKLIIRNPFEKKELELQLQRLTKIDQSGIMHHTEVNDDFSEINSIMRTIERDIN